VGIAARRIALRGLEVYAFNACETADDLEAFHKRLKMVCRSPDRRDGRELSMFEPISATHFSYSKRGDLFKPITRLRTSDTWHELLRMATAARHHWFGKGRWPVSDPTDGYDQPFTSFLPAGPPDDPFTSEPIRMKPDVDEFVCWSLGPDKFNDDAAVSYDPTNGTTSTGDIILRVSRKRRCPFKREGVRASTAETLYKQFPDGLPDDPFADTRGRDLTVTNGTTSLYIFSFGPDCDEVS
jgi:hypothetical protein